MEEEVLVLCLDSELGFGGWARIGEQAVFESSVWFCWAEVVLRVIMGE